MREKPPSIERIEPIEKLRDIVQNALLSAYRKVLDLGPRGIEVIPSPLSSYDAEVLRADWEAEEAVLDYLSNSGLSIVVRSEEHAWRDIGSQPADYLAVLDGIDGSSEFKKQDSNHRSGTMLGIFRGRNPIYDDYITGGIIEYPSGKLYTATKNLWAFAQEPGLQPFSIRANGQTVLTPESFYVDNNKDYKRMPETVNLLNGKGFKPKERLGSSAMHYAEVADGRIGGVIECNRKANLEIATAYGLIRESGGVMVNEEGESLGSKNYRQFGQVNDGSLLIITAATKELADEIIKNLK